MGIKNLNTLIVFVNTEIPDISVHLEYNMSNKNNKISWKLSI